MSDPTKTQQWKQCPKCGQHAYLNARVCTGCGREFKTQFNAQGKPVEVAPPTQQPFRYPEHPQQPVPYQQAPPPQQVYQQPTPFQQPYQQPYPPAYQPPPVQKNDLCAVLSVAMAGVGFLIFPCAMGPAAMILGIVSLFRINDNPELKGKAMAVIGLVVGTLWTFRSVIAMVQAAQALQQM